jgi:hypothetical protein
MGPHVQTEIRGAVDCLLSIAREKFPEVHPSLLRFSFTADGKELQIMAPGLRWHSIPLTRKAE